MKLWTSNDKKGFMKTNPRVKIKLRINVKHTRTYCSETSRSRDEFLHQLSVLLNTRPTTTLPGKSCWYPVTTIPLLFLQHSPSQRRFSLILVAGPLLSDTDTVLSANVSLSLDISSVWSCDLSN